MRMSLLLLAMLSLLIGVPAAHAIMRSSMRRPDNSVIEAYYYHNGHRYQYYSNHRYYNHRHWQHGRWNYY